MSSTNLSMEWQLVFFLCAVFVVALRIEFELGPNIPIQPTVLMSIVCPYGLMRRSEPLQATHYENPISYD